MTCPNKNAKGDCTLRNIQCSYPKCEQDYGPGVNPLPPLAPALLGRNEFKLNGATMQRAVQEFFDRHAPGLGVQVEHIRQNTPDGQFIVETFEVGTKP